MERLKLHLTLNTRDLGGYIGVNNLSIKNYKIIRSDALRYITEEDKLFLLKNNIKNQIDLRTEEICSKYPSALEDDSRFNYFNIPLKEGSLKSLEECPDIPSLYMRMISNFEAFKTIFKKIASIKEGLIINCTAGKDRTGIVIYMLLTLCGVKLEDIRNDYLFSQHCISEMLPIVRQEKPDFPEFLGYAKEEYFDKFLDLFLNKYNNLEDYLLLTGVTREEINTIRQNLL